VTTRRLENLCTFVMDAMDVWATQKSMLYVLSEQTQLLEY